METKRLTWQIPKLEYLGCALSRGCVACYKGHGAELKPENNNCKNGDGAVHKCDMGAGI